MLQKMGLVFWGGVQVSNKVKYYGMNKKSVWGNVPHIDYGFILLLDTHGGTFPRPYVTVVVYVMKLNVGRVIYT